MKVTQMPPVHAVNLVANSGNAAFRVNVTGMWNSACVLSSGIYAQLPWENEATTGGQPSFKDCPGVGNQICHHQNMPLWLSKRDLLFRIVKFVKLFRFRFITIPFLAMVLL